MKPKFLLKFCVISLGSMVVIGAVLGSIFASYMEQVVVRQAINDAVFMSRNQLDHHFTAKDLAEGLSESKRQEIDGIFQNYREDDQVALIKIWNRKGMIVYSTKRTLIDKVYPVSAGLTKALKNEVSAKISDSVEHRELSKEDETGRLIEVYTPIHSASGTQVIGSYETYFVADHLVPLITRAKKLLWLVLSSGLSVLYFFLFGFVRLASRALVEKEYVEDVNYRLQASLMELEDTYVGTIETLTATVDAKDNYTAGHSYRVSCFASILGRISGLDGDNLVRVEQAALFHDIGKIATPERILNKKGKLSRAEFELVKKHPQWGERIIEKIPFLKDRAVIIRQHHENYDGTGYPDRLRGEEISIEARILRIVDAYDALSSDRPYRGAKLMEESIALLTESKGIEFDPMLVDLFVKWLRENQPAALQHLALRV